jgi:hypothetical protein
MKLRYNQNFQLPRGPRTHDGQSRRIELVCFKIIRLSFQSLLLVLTTWCLEVQWTGFADYPTVWQLSPYVLMPLCGDVTGMVERIMV